MLLRLSGLPYSPTNTGVTPADGEVQGWRGVIGKEEEWGCYKMGLQSRTSSEERNRSHYGENVGSWLSGSQKVDQTGIIRRSLANSLKIPLSHNRKCLVCSPLKLQGVLMPPPCLRRDEVEIKKVQRRAARMSKGMDHLLYREKLNRIILFEFGKERPSKGREGLLVCGASWDHEWHGEWIRRKWKESSVSLFHATKGGGHRERL